MRRPVTQEAAKQQQTLSSEEAQSIRSPILQAQDAAEEAEDQRSTGPTMTLNMVRLAQVPVEGCKALDRLIDAHEIPVMLMLTGFRM